MKRWQVFAPSNGTAVVTVRYRWVARLISRIWRLDYALTWEGWV